MQITKETKIKDLIPEGYELRDTQELCGGGKDQYIRRIIDFKPKEKDFKDYVDEYRYILDTKWDVDRNRKLINWRLGNKLGFVWHIVQERNTKKSGVTWSDFNGVMEGLMYGVWNTTTKKYKDIFPRDFIEELREDLNC